MKGLKFIAAFALLSALLVSSCVKEKNFPTTPKIEFLYYTQYTPDSAGCVIKFTDGDGDIGIMDGDETTPNDYVLKYLYLDTIDNTFKPFEKPNVTPTFDTLFYTYRVPDITPEGQYKALDGEILAKISSAPLYWPEHTIVKFEIQLRDRAGHLSNRVMTREIEVNP